ncbi:ankyrin repeat domain-containing protein [Aspergillus melleus]|uniref:ankyrin repeat domain-containing protein n=1 Tax=Aspergillus melleus TaxID=138277 RepID=UPI001E8E6690|nr:uncharacterized protein LDX57_012227 [Aspergillus melleus]KAH8434584.1 hypothetical protein LDX57_012227 [Aspergillus melleus]
MGGISTDGWSNDVAAAHTLFSGNEPSTDEPITANINPEDDVMDYHTSELWHILQDTGHGPERIRPLLEQGANPNKLHKGYTALHLATTSGSISRMQVLLEYGAQGSVRTQPHGETALHLATFSFDLDKMKLLTSTTDINAQNAGGDTALHLVITRGHSLEALKSLLGHRASANIRGRLGRTPLVYALYLCQQRVAEVLLEAGADPNIADSQGRAALHYTAASDRFSCGFIRDLIKGGADVNQVDNNLKTPLHEAVKTGKGDVIRALVDAGADTKLGDPSFERRLQRALFWGGISEKLPWPLGNIA